MASSCGTTGADSASITSGKDLTEERSSIEVTSGDSGSFAVMLAQKDADNYAQTGLNGEVQSLETVTSLDDGLGDFGTTTVRQEPKFVQQYTGIVEGSVETKTGLINTGLIGLNNTVTAGGNNTTFLQTDTDFTVTDNDFIFGNSTFTPTIRFSGTQGSSSGESALSGVLINSGSLATSYMLSKDIADPDATAIGLNLFADNDGYLGVFESKREGSNYRYGFSNKNHSGATTADFFEFDKSLGIDTKGIFVNEANISSNVLYDIVSSIEYYKNESKIESDGFIFRTKVLEVSGVEDYTNANSFKLDQDTFEVKVLNGLDICVTTQTKDSHQISIESSEPYINYQANAATGEIATFSLDPKNVANGNNISSSNGTDTSILAFTPSSIDLTTGTINLNGKIVGLSSNTVVSATTYTVVPDKAIMYIIFNGTISTFTLPVLTGNQGLRLIFINKGSGIITLNSNTGANDIWEGGVSINTTIITNGTNYVLYNDGTNYSNLQ